MAKFKIHTMHACNAAVYIFVYFYVYMIMWCYFPLDHYIGDLATTCILPNVVIHMLRRFRRTSILLFALIMIFALDGIEFFTKGTYDSLGHYQLGRFFCEPKRLMPDEFLTSFAYLVPGSHSFTHHLIKETFICHSGYFVYPWLVGLISFPITVSYAVLYASCYLLLIGTQKICSIFINIVQ
jgi:hypothetical protein